MPSSISNRLCPDVRILQVFLRRVIHNYYVVDVLVLPRRVVTRLKDLERPELADLMFSVQHVGRVIERVYGADSLTIACQVSTDRI